MGCAKNVEREREREFVFRPQRRLAGVRGAANSDRRTDFHVPCTAQVVVGGALHKTQQEWRGWSFHSSLRVRMREVCACRGANRVMTRWRVREDMNLCDAKCHGKRRCQKRAREDSEESECETRKVAE